MACTGHCNQCITHPGYIGPETPTEWTDNPVDTNDEVKSLHFNELRSSIQEELIRRSLEQDTTYDDPGDVDTNDLVYKNNYRYIRNQISKASSYTWFPSTVTDIVLSAGQPILADSTNDMRDETNILEASCVCDCNYSCTCNCNYCTCDCNHACQCNCNY